MTEEDKTPVASVEMLLAGGTAIRDLMVEGMRVRIRPLTWRQEYEAAVVVGNYVKSGMPEEVAEREYMKLVVMRGLVEPKVTERQVQDMKWGHVKLIQDAISELTRVSVPEKKE